MIFILLQKRKVDPETQNLPDTETEKETDAVLIFKPHVVYLHYLFLIVYIWINLFLIIVFLYII